MVPSGCTPPPPASPADPSGRNRAVSLFDVESVDPRVEEGTTRVKLVVAYDGSGFHGFWPNEGVTTVGGTAGLGGGG